MKLLSDQVTEAELAIVLRELARACQTTARGSVVELGCYVGTTSVFIADYLRSKTSQSIFHVYDSFAGLPEKSTQDSSPAGDQFKTGELLATKGQFIQNFKRAGLPLPVIHKAWFEDLTDKDIPEQICFAFLDGDYYSSIKTSLKLIWPKLTAGAVVVVDDYQNEALPGAGKAVDEWLKTHPAKLKIEASLAILML